MTEEEQKLCELCNQNPVDQKSHVCKECYDKATYQEKAHLVLEGSEKYEWGMVKLTPGTVNFTPADSVLVGTWHRWGEGTYWVSLMLPVTALMDRATLLHAEVDKRREEGLDLLGKAPVRKARGVRPKKEKEVAQEDTTSKNLQALRDKLRPKA